MSKRKINREEVSSRILQAAEYEFGLYGYKGASLQNIAKRAGLPKANIVYYFVSKENLYKVVLNEIASSWNDVFDKATIEDDPAVVLDNFIRTKLAQSIAKPRSSRIFAMEVIQGAAHISEYLREELRPWLQDRINLIESWIAKGKMKSVDPTSLIFMIWATTQHYADFESQVLTLLDQEEYAESDMKRIGDTISKTILGGCGLSMPST
ncbi:Transcriptional Regulator, TetR family protein [Marinomonas sp. MED121]|uniref:TetR/AcrR family transcriptional regulator n=1 Tax=Marinomonas sp. MED121 TaxID=314277 RepID=UPI000068FDAA|nr:TetR/AcrR family transcriptional regulator [Marinomonas sp. MED121]EAQ65476.1 Transcriptional Regulator, TetR family protein [Marinomonas sp. MED121]